MNNSGTTVPNLYGSTYNGVLTSTSLITTTPAFPHPSNSTYFLYSPVNEASSPDYLYESTLIPITYTQGFTFCCWIWINSGYNTSNDIKCFELDSNNAFYLLLRVSYGQLSWGYDSNTAHQFNFTTNAWNHFCVTTTVNSGATYSVFWNGVEILSNILYDTTNVSNAGYLSNNLYLSYIKLMCPISSPHYSLNGYIADFRIYNSILPSSQITNI